MFKMTIAYPGSPDSRFDFDYYTEKHIPMVGGYIGEDVISTEVTKGLAGGDGGAAPWVATGTFWLKSLDGMQAAMAEHGAEIMGDIKNYTDLAPVVQVEEVTKVAELV